MNKTVLYYQIDRLEHLAHIIQKEISDLKRMIEFEERVENEKK